LNKNFIKKFILEKKCNKSKKIDCEIMCGEEWNYLGLRWNGTSARNTCPPMEMILFEKENMNSICLVEEFYILNFKFKFWLQFLISPSSYKLEG